MGRFDNKVSIITGSSNGIGKATAILFAKEGSKVTITGRNVEALQATKEECIKVGAKEEDILDIIGDITTEEVQNELINKTIEKFGKLDILVNNHGGIRHETNKEGEWNIETFDAVIDQNCKSTLAMCLKAIPHLKITKGNIVNVSSIASNVPLDRYPFYGMAKSAMDQLTRMLAYKYAAFGIRTNAINPGSIETTIAEKIGVPPEVSKKMKDIVSVEGIPMQRVGVPEEIAQPIAFLADDTTSSYMTGQTMIVDGGLTLDYAILRQLKKLTG